MLIEVCGKKFNTEDIRELVIREQVQKVFVDTTEDFYELRYTNENEIKEAKSYLRFNQITRTELIDAVNIIIMVCDHFINKKEQCEPCPLKKKEGCIFSYLPIEWRE